MSNDIKQMLERLATVEGRLTPTGVKHGLNAQQRGVPQLPALFKPKHIRALGSRTDPAHPMDGYMVGDSVEPRGTALEEAMAEIEEDMISKVKKDLRQYLDHLEKKGHVSNELKDKARDAIERGEVEEDDVEEDLSAADKALAGTKAFGQGLLKHMPAVGAAAQASNAINRAELGDKTGAAIAAAGMYPPLSLPAWGVELARDKYNTGSFFPDDEQIKAVAKPYGVMTPDPAPANQRPTGGSGQKQPWEHEPVKENAPVKTYTMEDGTCLECWGDEQNGFEIRHQGRSLPTRFPKIDHADIAVKLFQNRRRANQNQDYIEEK